MQEKQRQVYDLLEITNRQFNECNALYHAAAQRCGLSDAAFWVLYALCTTHEPQTQNRMAAEWGQPKQTLNSAVAAMVKKGLVALCPGKGAHSGKLVTLTDEGRALAERTVGPVIAAEQQAIQALAAGSEEAASLLIEHNLRLVVYIARRFENTGIHIEDLISIGTIGLIKAIHTFKPDKNIKLATYASRCIENEILMYLRKCSAQKTEVSIDEPLNTDWDGNELLLSDILGTDADAVSRPLEDDAERAMLLRAIETLGERDRQIILLRFGIGGAREATQKEVADLLGISQSYISRLEKRIIAHLRQEMLKQMQC